MASPSVSSLRGICFILIFSFNLVRLCHSRTYNLGILVPYTGEWSKLGPYAIEAIKYAVHKANTDPDLTALRDGGHRFKHYWVDTACEESQGLRALVDLWAIPGSVDVFIGPLCDNVCQSAGLLAGEWGLPMVSYGCASMILSDKDKYPTFARSLSTYTRTGVVVEALMIHFQWKRVTILFSPYDTWSTSAGALKTLLTKSGIQTNLVSISHMTEEIMAYNGQGLENLVDQTRVFVVYAETQVILRFMEDADRLNLLQGDYAFITVDVRLDAVQYSNQSLLEGVLDISIHMARESELYEHFISNVTRMVDASVDLSHKGDVHVALLHDAIILYADGLNRALLAGVNPTDHKLISSYLRNNSFEGLQGRKSVDEHGDTSSDYAIRNIRNGSYVPIMDYFNKKHTLEETGESIMWPGGSSAEVVGEPICGWQYEKCQSDARTVFEVTTEVKVAPTGIPNTKPTAQKVNNTMDSAWVLIVSCLMAILAASGIGLIIFKIYRINKRKMELISNAWRINYVDLQMDGLHGSKSQFGSRMSRTSSVGLVSLEHKSALGEQRGQVFTDIGHYLSQVVAVKNIRKPYIYLTKEIIQELNQVRNMRHSNLNQFIGACVEPNRISVVSLYCSKGSLQDVLENENIKLDRIFKLSFASDISQGMVYIHESPVVFHGRLKSSNILVDSRWTVKIADYGLRKFREGERNHGEHFNFYQLLWTAPEHLREDEISRTGSQKGDVYSFALVLQEILLRSGPFSSAAENAKGIIDRVTKGEHPPFRPKVMEDEAEEELLDLMRICWEEIAAFRPNFVTIRDSLRKMNKGRQTNLVDQMMHMMEIYADHLEDIVEDRTKQLIEEQKKTEELLCRMLPKTVAEGLKMGRTVNPESFGSVTIFFSDVVGFTALAAASSPLQVVNFLNDLYTCFDNVIEEYDVYKVETIGDAYMVASGLPVRNGIKHAGEIGTMALDLLSAVVSFEIRHQREKQLQLRIGIHTGPVVAGVVGMKMPRYCLFGDAVNYASRMESSGLALRIHVSPECKEALDQIGGFNLMERGEVTMKGKGTLRTYFLKGKDGFNKTLPDLALAAPMELHQFK